MNGKAQPSKLVRGALVDANGKRMLYEGPAIAFADDAAAAPEPLGLRIGVLVEKALDVRGGNVVIQAMNKALGNEKTVRSVLIVWRIPDASRPVALTLAAQLVARVQGKEKIHAVIVDDGADAWHIGVDDMPTVRATIEKMLRAEPDQPRVIAVL